MNIELSERQIIHILNCINYTQRKMMYSNNLEDKGELEIYYKYENYNEIIFDLNCIHKLISLKGNMEYYNLKNEIFFVGQKNYLTSGRNFKFLKKK